MAVEETPNVFATGAAALLFAATFLFGGRVCLIRERRTMISFGAGMSAAYVFVHLMPELHGARTAFVESTSLPLRHEGMAVYFVGLVGFLAFYGLEHLRRRARPREAAESAEGFSFRLHVGSFAVYVALTAYLLVHSLEESHASIAFFAGTFAVHFLTVDHSLREEYGDAYQRRGRFILAAASVFGWGAGLLIGLPRDVLALLVAFISGAVIMNSAVTELPSEKDGRFVPFLAGGLLYGLVLIPLG